MTVVQYCTVNGGMSAPQTNDTLKVFVKLIP